MFRKTIKAILGISGLVNVGHAALHPISTHTNTKKLNSDSLVTKQCTKLIELNEKLEISEKQYKEGLLLHSILSQISDEPIEYCEYTLAAHKIQQTDEIL